MNGTNNIYVIIIIIIELIAVCPSPNKLTFQLCFHYIFCFLHFLTILTGTFCILIAHYYWRIFFFNYSIFLIELAIIMKSELFSISSYAGRHWKLTKCIQSRRLGMTAYWSVWSIRKHVQVCRLLDLSVQSAHDVLRLSHYALFRCRMRFPCTN